MRKVNGFLRHIRAAWYTTVLNFSHSLVRDAFFQKKNANKRSLEFRFYVALVLHYLRTIEAIERQGTDFVRLVQNKRVRRIFSYAEWAPWWKNRFEKSGVRARDIRTVEDITRLPVVRRGDILDTPKEALLTKRLGTTSEEWVRSSGSTTGIPLSWSFEGSSWKVDHLAFALLRMESYGFSFRKENTRNFHLWINQNGKYDPYAFFSAGRFFLNRKDRELNRHVTEMARATEHMGSCIVVAPPSELSFFVKKLSELNLRPPITFCCVVGQPLEEETRDAVEAYLHCPVRAVYGMQEMGRVGIECETHRGWFHIFSERVIVEVLDHNDKEAAAGETGNIVVTCLDNTLMPLLRYETGDLGMLRQGHCACGLASPLLRIVARAANVLHLKNGATQSPKLLFKILSLESFSHEIRRIQIRQAALDRVIIYLETDRSIEREALTKLEKKAEEWHAYAFSVEIKNETPPPETKFSAFVPLARAPEDPV